MNPFHAADHPIPNIERIFLVYFDFVKHESNQTEIQYLWFSAGKW